MTNTDAWRQYPYELVPGEPQMQFPAAEGTHPEFQSDTWYLAGHLTGTKSGRRFAFITIFNRNRPADNIVADFYTFALFDTDNGVYGTYTDYDMPPKNMVPGAVPKLTSAEGHLDLRYDSSAGTVLWWTNLDADGELVPYTYDYDAVGTDQDGAPMRLTLHLTPTRGPVPVGGSVHNGRIVACLQDDTYSYFQTGLTMTGTLQWGDISEEVHSDSAHIDRQWFPRYAGGGGTGGDARGQAHEWHTIALDNGVDLSVWRQYDRRGGNVLVPFTGITATYEDETPPECVDDLDVTTTSYVRWPDEVRSLMKPLAQARYMPERHIVRSKTLDLDLVGEPLVRAPGHALPIEYQEGPYSYVGTMGGEPVTGVALYEASNAMYRDWELIDVLETQIAYHHVGSAGLSDDLSAARSLIAGNDKPATIAHLDETLRAQLAGLDAPISTELTQLLEGLIEAVRNDLH
ncbi:putative secreted hydrolase [Mycolicibacterium sp. BK556]|uniref:lipocalin-like domain-containing protein n=1 Tax=unclassified Mycolicibacterium TaxID=2636767 RepID=UPI00161BEA1E|nr:MULTISPECIES: lipocalin-like domain-containing protein [unclassified Mycolicibacterium]MBB3602805.1 putative secreted hydrolase [Mycolicibacterium sp. BK556]MBB3633000.1 putative secreted hydrolase [Mycolicibacterium sp. BK607]